MVSHADGQSATDEAGSTGVPSQTSAERSDRFTLLETPDFVADLQHRIDRSRDRILVQLMTFDGDAAGQDITDRLIRAAGRGVAVRLLLDCFVLRFVSDERVNRRSVRAEAVTTAAMYERLRAAGVELTFTHPNGPGNLFCLVRNHKKVIVVDDHVYLGGINISDHNFSWHDFMIGIRDDAILDAVIEDLELTVAGGRGTVDGAIVTNEAVERVFDCLVLGAERSVDLASPYAIDVGLTRVMAKATRPRKRVIIAKRSNYLVYRVMSPYLQWRLRRCDTSLAAYDDFSHSKFLLVDDDKLLVGSSNFGRHSFWCNQEICLLITDVEFIAQFKATLLQDTEPIDLRPPVVEVALGALVSYLVHGFVIALRLTVASRVPNLSQR